MNWADGQDSQKQSSQTRRKSLFLAISVSLPSEKFTKEKLIFVVVVVVVVRMQALSSPHQDPQQLLPSSVCAFAAVGGQIGPAEHRGLILLLMFEY